MADLLRVSRNISRLTRPTRGSDTGLTDYEREMRYNYIPEAKEDYEKEKKKRGFLSVVFDFLQTGNYVSANVVDSIYDSVKNKEDVGPAIINALKEAWKGLTWQEKTTFKDVIQQNVEEHGDFLGGDEEFWEKPLFEVDPSKAKTKAGTFLRGLAEQFSTPSGIGGFVGDVALDPLTYVSPMKWFSQGKRAANVTRAVAGKYAPDVLKLKKLMMNADDLARLSKGKLTKEAIEKVITNKGVDAAWDYLQKKGGVDISRYMNDILKEAQEKAYRTSGDVLQKEMREELAKATGMTEDIAKGVEDKFMGKMDTYDEFMQRLPELEEATAKATPWSRTLDTLGESIEGGYQGAGMQASRFPLVGEYNIRPMTETVLTKGWDKIKGAIKASPAGSKFSDMWWSVMNNPNSPVAMIKKSLGIRNAYQKLLNVQKIDAAVKGDQILSDMVDHSMIALRELGGDDKLWDKALQARAIAEQIELGVSRGQKGAKKILNEVFGGQVPDVSRLLDSTDLLEDLKKLGITPEEGQKITKFWDQIDNMFKQMRETEGTIAAEGIIPDYEELINLIPKKQNVVTFGKRRAGGALGTQTPGFTQHTGFTTLQSEAQGMAKIKYFFGDIAEQIAKADGRPIDDVLKEIVSRKNLSPVSTSLPELLNHRIIAHARTVQRAELVRGFRELGIPVNAISDAPRLVQAGINRPGGGIESLGLAQSSDPAMTGFFFDNDMRDIIDKTYAMTASDDAMAQWKKVFANYTQWWKGIVTATTGFHIRNFYSNNITGVFRHGMNWFNPQMYRDAWIGSYYSLHPQNYVDVLKKNFNVDEGIVHSALNRRIGNYTIKDLADYAREKGVISLKTYISDVEKRVGPKVSIGKKVNPLSSEWFVTKASRELGDQIENGSRFHSFLLSYDELAKAGGPDDAILEWAKLDTKKWFIDYNDLTEVERKYLKPIIPFYTWMRKNLANQISGVMIMPEMYALAAKTERAVTLDDFDATLMPDWQKDLGYLPISRDPETGNVAMWWPNLPYQELNKIPLMWEEGGILPKIEGMRVFEDIMSSAHPLIKQSIQAVTGKNMFQKRDFFDNVRAPGLTQFLANQPEVVSFLDGAMRRMGYENGLRVDVDDGRLMIDERMEQAMSNYIPVLRTLDKFVDLSIDLTGLEEVFTKATGRKDEHEGLEDFLQSLSYFAGLKFKELDAEKQKEIRDRAIEEAAQEARNEARKSTPAYSSQRMQYAAQRKAQRRAIGL